MVAAWFITVVVVWPILTALLLFACMGIMVGICFAFFDPEAREGCGMFMSLAVLPYVFVLSPIVAAFACYMTCRRIAVPWNESKPAAIQASTISGVLVALLLAVGFWVLVWLWATAP